MLGCFALEENASPASRYRYGFVLGYGHGLSGVLRGFFLWQRIVYWFGHNCGLFLAGLNGYLLAPLNRSMSPASQP